MNSSGLRPSDVARAILPVDALAPRTHYIAMVVQLRAAYVEAQRRYRQAMAEHGQVADVALAVAIGVLGLAEAHTAEAALGSVVLAVALSQRRRWPLAVFVVCFGLISGLASEIPLASFVGVLVAGYSLSAYGRWALLSFSVLLASAIFVTVAFRGDLSFLPQELTGFLVIGTIWLAGSAIRVRQRRADDIEERARAREREQVQEQEIALAAQRAQIARELHDVVTHSVSVMVIQAGAARHVLARDPDQARTSLLAVEARGREALAELRGFLGVLDVGSDRGAVLVPQPGTGDIAALVQGVAGAGLPVTLQVTGEPRALPHGVDLAAYRVVQEALTNAIKYAGGSATAVMVDYRAGEVAVEVIDQGPARAEAGDGTGRGLSGLRERLAVYGGRLEAGRRPGGGYAVRAWIPTGAGAP